MRSRVYFFWAAIAASIAFSQLLSANVPTTQDARLVPALTSSRIWNAVATADDGRIFVAYSGADAPGPQVQELAPDGTSRPYPDASWHSWSPGQDPKDLFVHVNALRLGPDGNLWVVDAGAPGLGKPAVPGGARIFQFDLKTNQLARTYALAGATKPNSFINDIRFNGRMAYVTDAGAPALIVLDLETGQARRVLEDDVSTTDSHPMYADGKLLRTADGTPLHIHADQLEVSPDGRYLYFQPASGPLARIETSYLDDPKLSPATVASHVDKDWADTPTTGGTAIDAKGTIYLSDTNHRRILQISPTGKVTTLISDPRLVWSDAMWIDHDDFLWIPASQKNLTADFNRGRQQVRYPVVIYKMKIDAGPSTRDHS
jgi:sugar lactone lactonase YvrE